MKQPIVFTVIARDKPGIVTDIADVLKAHGGNWLDSRMSQLAGEFAGIVHAEIARDQHDALLQAFKALIDEGVSITVRPSNEVVESDAVQLVAIDAVGADRPGIVSEFTQLFSEQNINLIEFDTALSEASMSGGMLFHANAVISVDAEQALDDIQEQLQNLGDELLLDIQWTAPLS